MRDASFKNKAAETELRAIRIGCVLIESFCWSNVEDELVLEVVEDDDDEAGDAAESERVGPETPVLELASACADVDSGWAGRVAAGGGGEEAEEGDLVVAAEIGERAENRRLGFD